MQYSHPAAPDSDRRSVAPGRRVCRRTSGLVSLTTMSTDRTVANFHTHCYLCDGEGAPADYARAAVERGLVALGFSSHAPLPFPVDWVMTRGGLSRYSEEAARAVRVVDGKLPVFVGLEIDYVPDLVAPDGDAFPEIELDYIIGSVHFVRGDADEYLTVDGPIDEFLETLDRGFSGDAKALVGEYLANIRSMLTNYRPDVLGHIDVVRKNNGEDRFFDSSARWYRSEMMSVVEAAAKNGCIVEVNTGALARGKNVIYPERWVARELVSRGVRMMVNSDAHRPDRLTFGYEEAFALLRSVGCRDHWILTHSGWRSLPIGDE